MQHDDRYDADMPRVQAHVDKYEKAFERVRRSHAGRPVDEVRTALTAAFAEEDIEVWSEVAADAARLISEHPVP